ncbi:MAG: delta-60 repeat domain-containing protein [Labilithrix sp.]
MRGRWGAAAAAAIAALMLAHCTDYGEDSPAVTSDGGADGATATTTDATSSADGGTPIDTDAGAKDGAADAGAFSIAVTATPVVIETNGRADVAVQITRSPAFTKPVSFTVSGLPSGVAFESKPATGETGLITLAATNATVGDFTLTITAFADNEATTSTTMTLTVHASGQVDSSFASGKEAIVTSGTFFRPSAMLVEPDGKIVIGGTQKTSTPHLVLARLRADGALDSTFGTGGITVTSDTIAGVLAAIVRQSDGSLVAAGTTSGATTSAMLVRFTSTGQLDKSFGAAGRVVLSNGDTAGPGITATSLTVAPATQSLVLGGYELSAGKADLGIVARFTAGGVLDTTFGDPTTHYFAHAFQPAEGVPPVPTRFDSLVVEDNGTTIAGGSLAAGTPTTFFAVITATGVLSPNNVTTTTQRFASQLGVRDMILRSGKPLAVAASSDGTSDTLTLVELGSDGADGTVFPSTTSSSDHVTSLAAQKDGKILVLGHTSVIGGALAQPEIVRFTSPTARDTAFGFGGVLKVFDNTTDPVAIAVAPDGRIVVLGATLNGSLESVGAVVRRYYP